MNKLQLIFSVIIITVFTLVSCGKETDSPTVDDTHKLLYDKWWYSVDNEDKGDEYFNSDGTCQMTIPPASGTWTWKANDSLLVQLNGYPAIVLHFLRIDKDTMEYWPAFEPVGVNYQFSTTKP